MNLLRMEKKVLEAGKWESAVADDEDVEHQGRAEKALFMLKKNLAAMTIEDQRMYPSYTTCETLDETKEFGRWRCFSVL